MGRSVLVLTGEPSGDLAGARLAEELRRRDPSIRVLAVGGERLRAAGAVLLADIRDLGAMGFAEVIRQIPRHAALEKAIVSVLDSERPDVVIPVDYPGFNLRIAAHAKSRGIPVVYYIAPQVWAWGRARMRKIARVVDRLLVVLPFEEALFREAGIDARFVGHPLLEGVETAPSRERARAALELGADACVLGLLPGSRVQEVRHILPVLLEAARRLRAVRPALAILVSRARSVRREELVEVERTSGARLVEGDAALVARASDVVFVTSGTATLEAALLGTPLAVVYRTSQITWSIGKALVRLPRIGLANIVAGEDVAPEFLQGEARAENLAEFAESLFRDPAERARRSAKLSALQRQFEGKRASRLAADAVLEIMRERAR